jgi:signal transduction histidine kinase
MALWALFSLVFIILSATSVGTVWAFNTYILSKILSGSTYVFVLSSAIGATAALLIFLGCLFLILARIVAVPMRRLEKAMATYAENNTHSPLSNSWFLPYEIKMLNKSFVDLTAKVEASHGRDGDVSRMKSDFISTAAHQLRTPLTGIRWALEALVKSGINEDQQVLVQNAVDKSHELVAIVGTLLDISSIESGKYKYKFAPVNLVSLAESITHDLSPMASERQVSLIFVRGEVRVPDVRADADRIKWIINNLVENAIRYTPAGGSIRVTAEAVAGHVFLKVRDTGIGISTEDRGSIFERFYRGENARAKENEGNGLGLYIARTVATDHGGDLSFEPNKEGPGTTFVLTLPIAQGA